MRLNIKNIIFIFVIVSLFLGDLLLYSGILNMFFKDKETIWAGLIAFTGAILGGAITYYGVKLQIQHREKEIFMSTVTETLTKINVLMSFLTPSFNSFFFLEHCYMDEDIKARHIRRSVIEFNKVLTAQKDIVYKYIDYELVELIEFHQKFLHLQNEKLSYKEAHAAMEKCRDIYTVLNNGKERVKQKYRKYKRTE
ncbi:hypothetical protein LRS76_17980 [Bacillus amyloliquefaciens]|uniref:hypothetical protein n=1 Tax=Bacillus TaxID=1386 RepID=UPI000FF8F932|nr:MULTISPECIES: hypothetical protein [Bacillus]KAF6540144.1 hypothetical protein G9F75_05075 [Bacillus sp. EKM208B]MBN7743499.1 hypothetical protein [Bacillus velezensis]MCC8308495.1 hypothetical protein [Bacillus velezensis]MCC8313292.1 hypothetical protein [Bacillus velezensis]MCD5429602.1 hypothetical protein [Bacillus amyloliquefaciens]